MNISLATRLLLFVVITLFVRTSILVAQETQTNHILNNQGDLIPGKAYRATNSVAATNITIAALTRNVFRSENAISLGAGFKVKLGAEFRAEIGETMLVYDDGGSLVYETDDYGPMEELH